jgi:guanylate kinase
MTTTCYHFISHDEWLRFDSSEELIEYINKLGLDPDEYTTSRETITTYWYDPINDIAF